MPSSGRWMALFAGEFRRLRAASFFPSDGKETKGSPGDAADGHSVPIGPLTPGPPFTGVTPWVRQKISGAQNLSGGSEFPPGHWALGLQKLRLVRFNLCAWLCRANAFGANPGGPVWDRPLRRRETVFVIRRRGGSQTRPLKPSPFKGEGVWPEARRMRVLSWYAHPPAGGPRASPTQTRKICGKPVRLGRATARGRPYRAARTYARPGTPGRPSVPPLRKSGNVSGYAVPLSRT